jgi:hypothetical protein
MKQADTTQQWKSHTQRVKLINNQKYKQTLALTHKPHTHIHSCQKPDTKKPQNIKTPRIHNPKIQIT